MRREFNRHFKSLLHFDFPYYGEPGDGCRDEIGLVNWQRRGSIKFAGEKIPYDEKFAPKFGYRCLRSVDSNSYLSGDLTSTDIFEIYSSKEYTFEFFIYPMGDGDIFALYSGSNKMLSLSISGTSIIFNMKNEGLDYKATGDITLNKWQQVSAQIFGHVLNIYVDGERIASGSTYLDIDTATEARLGGFNGYLDEFLYRTGLNSTIPTQQPYQGRIDINALGGKGDGRHGIGLYTSKNSNLRINTVCSVKNITNATTFTLQHEHAHTHGAFAVGDEVFLLVKYKTGSNAYKDLGLYSFRHIKARSGSTLTLDSPVNEFDFSAAELTEYNIHVYKVPNYESFTLGENAILKPRSRTSGADVCPEGLVIFRVQGDCTINGKILTDGRNIDFPRVDNLQMCNSELPERFLMNSNGGIFIVCGGKFTAGANARIGQDWAGDTEGGVGVKNSPGTNGGAGYGGGGGSSTSRKKLGGTGGVGGGGGGTSCSSHVGGDAGSDGTGGAGHFHTGKYYQGGTQGITAGGASPFIDAKYPTGGGGAFGNSASNSISGAMSGPVVLIACDVLNVDSAAISTGGGGGKSGEDISTGGGGTGLCYIACREMI